MGKGDKKSKRGKIFMGTYGKTRPRKSSMNVISLEKKKIKPKKKTAKKKQITAYKYKP